MIALDRLYISASSENRNRFFRIRSVTDYIAETDDFVGAQSVDLFKSGFERENVTMYIRNYANSHRFKYTLIGL